MRVLVTGASGFVGGAIAQYLEERGHDVNGLSRGRLKSASCRQRPCSVIDLASRGAVARFAKDTAPCDVIVHAAASLSMALHDSQVVRANCVGMQNVLWLQDAWAVPQVIYLSSVPVIGRPLENPVTESHPVNPTTVYHASKVFGEHLMALAAARGVRATTLRLTAPVGPRVPNNRLISVLVRAALEGSPLLLDGTGSRRQDYVDVRDVSNAIHLCLTGQPAALLNIASGRAVSNLDLARSCIQRCASSSEIIFTGQSDPDDTLNWSVSIDRARDSIGYAPTFGLDDAIQCVVDEAER